jgi:hypothetical protein
VCPLLCFPPTPCDFTPSVLSGLFSPFYLLCTIILTRLGVTVMFDFLLLFFRGSFGVGL